jgi:acylphosphatase
MNKAGAKTGSCVEIIISGRVQGVGFRYFTLLQAKRLGICGKVRNLSNGDVIVHAEGGNLPDFITELKKGPPFAKVTNLMVRELPAEYQYEDFRIE